VSLVTLEKDRVIAFGRDPKNFSVVAGGDEEVSGFVESEIPDVFGAGLEVDGRTPGGIYRRSGGVFLVFILISIFIVFILIFIFFVFFFGRCRLHFAAGGVFEFVDFAVGSGGGEDYASGCGLQRLYLKFFGLKNNGCLAIGGDAIHAGGRAGRDVDVTGIVGGDGPDVGGRRGVEALEGGSELDASVAADSYAGGCAFG